MNWQEIGTTWLAQLGENRPEDEPEEQWEDWPEDAPDAPPKTQPSRLARFGLGQVRFGPIRPGLSWASLALGGLLVVAIGVSHGEPVEPPARLCLHLLPPLHRHGVTGRPLARPAAAYGKCV